MQILRSIAALQEFAKTSNKTIGFVPTMGALHAGHVSLIKKSVEQNECTIVSTFVNPVQFLPGEDFEKYPKNEVGDVKICEMCGADSVFIPDAKDMYLGDEPLICAPKELASKLEGALRPGHFDGVLRVINKFFNIIFVGKFCWHSFYGHIMSQFKLFLQFYIKFIILSHYFAHLICNLIINIYCFITPLRKLLQIPFFNLVLFCNKRSRFIIVPFTIVIEKIRYLITIPHV